MNPVRRIKSILLIVIVIFLSQISSGSASICNKLSPVPNLKKITLNPIPSHSASGKSLSETLKSFLTPYRAELLVIKNKVATQENEITKIIAAIDNCPSVIKQNGSLNTDFFQKQVKKFGAKWLEAQLNNGHKDNFKYYRGFEYYGIHALSGYDAEARAKSVARRLPLERRNGTFFVVAEPTEGWTNLANAYLFKYSLNAYHAQLNDKISEIEKKLANAISKEKEKQNQLEKEQLLEEISSCSKQISGDVSASDLKLANIRELSKCPTDEKSLSGTLICPPDTNSSIRFQCLHENLIAWENSKIRPTLDCMKKMINEMQYITKESDCKSANPTLTCAQEDVGRSILLKYSLEEKSAYQIRSPMPEAFNPSDFPDTVTGDSKDALVKRLEFCKTKSIKVAESNKTRISKFEDKSKCPVSEQNSNSVLICPGARNASLRFQYFQDKLVEWEKSLITPSLDCIKQMVEEMKLMTKESDCKSNSQTLTCEQEDFGWELLERYSWL